MGIKENFQKDVLAGLNLDPELNASPSYSSSKFIRNLKRFGYLICLVLIMFAFNKCAAGYISSEPDYVQYDRPVRPNNISIWIDGDWSWSNHSHGYVQKPGYWENPRHGKSYVSGRWQSTPKGKSWSKGYWHSDGSNRKNHRR
jgi:hypothetical protein